MIDIHAHILAGIDDGPRTWEDALKLAKLASQSGINTVVATPHYQFDNALNTLEKVRTQVQHFRELLAEQGIPLKVVPGSEIMLRPGFFDYLKSQQFATINDTGRYVLLQLPVECLPINTEEVILELRAREHFPVIAHPERNWHVIREPNALLKLIEAGALIQVNASSLTGRSGYRAMRTAEILLLHNMVHFLASDMHCFETRAPDMARARRKAEKLIGTQPVKRLVLGNPQKVLNGEEIVIEQPLRYRRFVGSLKLSGKMFMQQLRINCSTSIRQITEAVMWQSWRRNLKIDRSNLTI